MRIREALKVFSGATVSHPAVPARKLQSALLTILSAARRQADEQDRLIEEINNESEELCDE